MKIRADEVEVENEISFTYDVWRGFSNWTPVKTGYREVIKVDRVDDFLIQLTFRDSSSRIFNDTSLVELKRDWVKVEQDNTIDSESQSTVPSIPSTT